ncbi:hypothetical protein BYT27DRAFT_7191847 [Phlegmacium glaucopus]|nr:hypothetical protein BYT27DRAFT_7191847 [Phlegmacium glaucopus]
MNWEETSASLLKAGVQKEMYKVQSLPYRREVHQQNNMQGQRTTDNGRRYNRIHKAKEAEGMEERGCSILIRDGPVVVAVAGDIDTVNTSIRLPFQLPTLVACLRTFSSGNVNWPPI